MSVVVDAGRRWCEPVERRPGAAQSQPPIAPWVRLTGRIVGAGAALRAATGRRPGRGRGRSAGPCPRAFACIGNRTFQTQVDQDRCRGNLGRRARRIPRLRVARRKRRRIDCRSPIRARRCHRLATGPACGTPPGPCCRRSSPASVASPVAAWPPPQPSVRQRARHVKAGGRGHEVQ